MREIIKLLDENLEYKKHEIIGDTIKIYAESKETKAQCPYCGEESGKIHSRNIREIQDIPISGKKVTLMVTRRKLFCVKEECPYRTFAERYEFVEANARKTKRLQDEIMRVSLTQSSMSASKYLRQSVANVGKSTICNLLKKR